MKRLIKVAMWILFFFALFIGAAYFLPKLVTVERTIKINAPAKVVFAQINDLYSWEKWAIWNQLDPNMKIEYMNHGVGEGSGYNWDSSHNKVGKGTLQIIESVPYDSIVIVINFDDDGISRNAFYFKESDSITDTSWNLTYDTGYNPFTRWFGLILGNFIGPDFEKSLENLKIVCEVQDQENSLIKELVELEGFNYAGIRKKVSFPQVGLSMGEMYGVINNFISSSTTEIAGAPFAVYHTINGEEIDLECGIPIANLINSKPPINTAIYQSTPCITVDYYGDYQQLEDAHSELQAWMDLRKFKLAGPPLEFYLTDPATEQNPEKWLTKIYYPVK